jgi:hypothetical protein
MGLCLTNDVGLDWRIDPLAAASGLDTNSQSVVFARRRLTIELGRLLDEHIGFHTNFADRITFGGIKLGRG